MGVGWGGNIQAFIKILRGKIRSYFVFIFSLGCYNIYYTQIKTKQKDLRKLKKFSENNSWSLLINIYMRE